MQLFWTIKATWQCVVTLRHLQDVRVSGATGPCSSGNNKSTLASEVELGMGGTTSWKLCVLNHATSLGMFFETVAAHGSPLEPGHILTLQFQTQYQHPCGQQRLRVTTVARPWAEPGSEQVGIHCLVVFHSMQHLSATLWFGNYRISQQDLCFCALHPTSQPTL